jgi:hypothetical protein
MAQQQMVGNWAKGRSGMMAGYFSKTYIYEDVLPASHGREKSVCCCGCRYATPVLLFMRGSGFLDDANQGKRAWFQMF